ncbi:MAG: hypothetical protein FJ222_01535 [Lentisphaerae bacterium]|nr:hypothetical protein [Lentisphaerota bacterium]
MKRIPMISTTLALALVAVTLATGCSNKGTLADPQSLKNHPESLAVIINGFAVTWEAVDRRARAFLQDEKTFNHLAFAPEQEPEALDHFRRRAVKIEVMRQLLLEEARQQRIVVTEQDRQIALARLVPLMARRNWTTNDFFTRSPLGPEQTRAEFEESLYIDKLLNEQVPRTVSATTEEIAAATAELARLRPDAQPKPAEIRQFVIRSKAKQAANDYYRKLVASATIQCAFPDLVFEEVMAAE